MAKFIYNNKVYTGTRVLPFQANCGQDLRMGFELRKKEKYKGATKFVERIKGMQEEEAKAALAKAQEEIRQYADRHRGEAGGYKVRDLVLLSTKDLK